MYRIATAIAAGLLVAALAAGTSALGRSTPNEASVDAKVAEQIAAHGRTTFWVVLRQQANLTPAHSMRPAPRGRYVYDTLTATADRTQQSSSSYLAQQHVPLQVLLDPERDPGDGRQHAAPGACRARPRSRRSFRTSSSSISPDAARHAGSRPRTPWSGASTASTRRRSGRRTTIAARTSSSATSTPESSTPTARSSRSTAATSGAATSTTTTTGGIPSAVCGDPGHRATTTARHAHDGHDGRRRRQSGHEPDRRRPAREVDRGQGLRDQQLLDERAAVLGPIHGGADRPQRPEPAAEHAARHRQQLVGQLERRRYVLPGDRAGLGRVRDLPVVLERELGAGLRNRRLAGELRRELRGRIVRHQQRDRGELEPRPVSIWRDHQAEHRRAGRQRALVLEQRELSDDQRHLDGRASPVCDRGPDLVGRSGASAEHLGHGGDPQPDGDRHARRLRRDQRRTTTPGARASSMRLPPLPLQSVGRHRRLRRHLRRHRHRLLRRRHRRAVLPARRRSRSGTTSSTRRRSASRSERRSAGRTTARSRTRPPRTPPSSTPASCRPATRSRSPSTTRARSRTAA